jgi:hypothetical protein
MADNNTNLVMSPRWVPGTNTNWPADRWSKNNLTFNYADWLLVHFLRLLAALLDVLSSSLYCGYIHALYVST